MFKNFDISVYTKDLEFLGTIDLFNSLRWRRKYYEAGEFELHMSLDAGLGKFLIKDNILIREDAIEVGIIESIQKIDNGTNIELIIFGRFLSSILDRRIIKNRINFSGKVLDGERKILNEMTPFNKLEVKETTIDSNSIVFQVTYKNVYEYLVKLAKNSTIAHRIIADLKNKKFIYENYVGKDRTESQKINPRYEFSEDKSNLEKVEYTFDAKTEKNYALVGGSGEGDERILVEVKSGDYSDFDLRETFIDSSSEQKTDEISLEDYQTSLKTIGKENLMPISEEIEVSVYADDYKKNWDLGDVVNVKKESWNIGMKKRIIEIEETIEKDKQSIYVTFSDPFGEELEVEE